jgi:hypothetical protein
VSPRMRDLSDVLFSVVDRNRCGLHQEAST